MGSTNPNVRIYISTDFLAQQQLFFFCNLIKSSHTMSVLRMVFLIGMVGIIGIIQGKSFNSELKKVGMDDMEDFGNKEMSRSAVTNRRSPYQPCANKWEWCET